MSNDEKIQVKDRLLDLIDKLHNAQELVELDDTALARVLLSDVAGQVQRLTLKLRAT